MNLNSVKNIFKNFSAWGRRSTSGVTSSLTLTGASSAIAKTALKLNSYKASTMMGAGFVASTLYNIPSAFAIPKPPRFKNLPPSSLMAGPGYISWSKRTGMPAGNLSTDGLSLSLSKMRHSSIL